MSSSAFVFAVIATFINLGAVLVNFGIHVATVRQNRDRLQKLESAIDKMVETVITHAERITRVEDKIEVFLNGKFQGKFPEQEPPPHHESWKP